MELFDLADELAILTGGGGGIGLAIAHRLGRAGAAPRHKAQPSRQFAKKNVWHRARFSFLTPGYSGGRHLNQRPATGGDGRRWSKQSPLPDARWLLAVLAGDECQQPCTVRISGDTAEFAGR